MKTTDKSTVSLQPLETKIKTELEKENVTEKVINGLKERYGTLKLNSVDDKETYLEIKEAHREVRKWYNLAVNICKKGRESAIQEQKLWIAKEKEVCSKIDEVANPLKLEIEKFDAEEKRKEDEEKQRKENIFISRQAEITKMGALYDTSNNCFVLGDVSFEISMIKESDEETYNEIVLPKYKAAFELLEAKRIEEERIKKEAEENQRKEAEELRLKEEQLRKEKEELQRQADELRKMKEELERKEKEEEVRKQMEEQQRLQKLFVHRSAILSGLGMKFNGQDFLFEDVNVNMVEIKTLDESAWVKLITEITPVIEQRKKEAEEKETARKKLEWENQQVELRRLEEIKMQEELEKASDKEKWESLLEQLSKVNIPTFKSRHFINKATIVSEKLEEIKHL